MFSFNDAYVDLGGKMMVTLDVITSGVSNNGNWFWIAVFFFVLWAITLFLLAIKGRKVRWLK